MSMNIEGLLKLGHKIEIVYPTMYHLTFNGDSVIHFESDSDSIAHMYLALIDSLEREINNTYKIFDDFVDDPDTTCEDEPISDIENEIFERQKIALEILK